MNTGVIDNFTNVFTTYIDSGFGLLNGEVAYLASTLIVIDITLAGLFWAWAADEDVLAHLVKKTLYIGFFAFLIGNFNGLAQIIYNSFAGIGLKAAGSNLSAAQLAQPGRVAQVGLTASQPLLDAAGQLVGPVAFFSNFVVIVVLVVAWFIVIAAFFIMAVQLFVTLIEFKLTTLAGFILVPFGLFNQTAFLAEKVLGNVVASGVKVLVLAVVVGIGTTLFSQFNQGFGGNPPTFEGSLSLALAALSLLGLSIYAPGIATGLVSAAPQLGAGAAVGTLQAATGVVATTAGAMRPAVAAAERVTRVGGSSMSSASTLGGPPAWARGLATMRRGVSSASHAVRSGDQSGGGYDVKLSEDDS
jgi:type IV secretion system protein TrbL